MWFFPTIRYLLVDRPRIVAAIITVRYTKRAARDSALMKMLISASPLLLSSLVHPFSPSLSPSVYAPLLSDTLSMTRSRVLSVNEPAPWVPVRPYASPVTSAD